MTFHTPFFGSVDLPDLEARGRRPGQRPDGVRIVRRPKPVRFGEVRS